MTDRLASLWDNFVNGLSFLNIFSATAYQEAADNGFHKNESDGDGIPNFGNYISNLHSEGSELWEAWRKNKLNEPCDKADKMRELGLEPLTCAEEEIADIVIRTMDTAARLKVNVPRAVLNKILFNRSRGHRYGGKLA